MADPLFDEMVKTAALKNAHLVDPPAKPEEDSGKGDKLAHILYAMGLGADVGTTAYGAASGKTTEANPLIKWAGNKGSAPVVAGMSAGAYLLANKLLKKNHPKILRAIQAGMAGSHGAAAASNIHQMTRAKNNVPAGGGPPSPGMVKGPDGSWYNPDYITIK